MLRTSVDKMKDYGFKQAKERSRRYPAQIITDVDYADDIAHLKKHLPKPKLCYIVKTDKTEYTCFTQRSEFSTLNGSSLKVVYNLAYLGSNVSSTETDINTRLAKAWTTIDSLSVIWMSDLTEKMKRRFFQAAVVFILLYGCTTWTLSKRMEKKLNGNYSRMLRAILNQYWW